MINLVDNMNGFFELHKAISIDPVKEIPVDYCPECNVKMKEIDSEGRRGKVPSYGCQPDNIKTSVTYWCPECGEEIVIDLED